jgi:hypothetical protein
MKHDYSLHFAVEISAGVTTLETLAGCRMGIDALLADSNDGKLHRIQPIGVSRSLTDSG